MGKLAVEEEEEEERDGDEFMATVAAADSLVLGCPVARRGGGVPEGRGWPLFNSCFWSCWRKRGGTSLGG